MYTCMTNNIYFTKCLDLSMCWWRCTDYRCMTDVYMYDKQTYFIYFTKWGICLDLSMCCWRCTGHRCTTDVYMYDKFILKKFCLDLFEHVLMKVYWLQMYDWCTHLWQIYFTKSLLGSEHVLVKMYWLQVYGGCILMHVWQTNIFDQISAWIWACVDECVVTAP